MTIPSLAEVADELVADREEIRDVDTKLKALKKAFREKEQAVLARMADEGALKVTGMEGTISVSIQTLADIEDWDKFYDYIWEEKAFHLLERRPASKAWREEVEIRHGEMVPGTKGFEKRTLNLRST